MPEKLSTTMPGLWTRNQDLEPLGDAASIAADQAARAAADSATRAAAARIQSNQFPWVGAVLAVGAVIAFGWLIKER